MLIEWGHHIERQGGNPRNLTLQGQKKSLGTWAICKIKMNMLLHGLPEARNDRGDTSRDPKLVDDGELLLYARVRPGGRQPAVQFRRVGPRGG